jgi:hypothetical protein
MKRIFVTIILSFFFTNSAFAFYPSDSSPSTIMPATSSRSNLENQSYNGGETFKVSATDVQTEDSGVTPIEVKNEKAKIKHQLQKERR